MMTVKEYMNTTQQEYIKLGADKGSSYIFCGKPSDFETFEKEYSKTEYAELLKNEKKISTDLNKYEEKSDRRILNRCEEHIKDKLYKTEKSEFVKFADLEEYVQYLKRTEMLNKIKLQHQPEIIQMRIYFFTDIREREVLKISPSITKNKYGVVDEIVMYQGYETGKYWDLSEYENGGPLD